MATFTKIKFSGSTNGRNVKIAATATAGTTIHTAHATATDEIWLWATNSDTADRKVTIEFGGVTAPDDLIEFTVPYEDGPYLLIPGWTLTGSVVMAAFAASANVVTVNGYVNRIQ
jgi:hypothetical protein